jgi:APA family basic amino acid/polyamine antiporter
MVGQLPMAIAADGLFPAFFGRLTSTGTPALGMLVSGVLSTALILMNYSQQLVALFTKIILLATLSTLVPYVFCSLAALVLMPGASGTRAAGKGIGAIASLAFVYALVAIGGAGQEVVYLGFLLLIAGLPMYVWVVKKKGASESVTS